MPQQVLVDKSRRVCRDLRIFCPRRKAVQSSECNFLPCCKPSSPRYWCATLPLVSKLVRMITEGLATRTHPVVSHLLPCLSATCAGTIPAALGELTALRWLILSQNKLTGEDESFQAFSKIFLLFRHADKAGCEDFFPLRGTVADDTRR